MMEHHVTESGALAVEILQEMGYWDATRHRRPDASESGVAYAASSMTVPNRSEESRCRS